MKHEYLIRLDLSWSISRGRDTYGYNICRLDDSQTGKRYKCSGGGYDMTGTVLADWLTDTHQEKLLALAPRAYYTATKNAVNSDNKRTDSLYGMYFYPDKKRVSLDGACGLSTVIEIINAIGFGVQTTHNKRGHTTGFIIFDKEAQK